MSALVKGNFHTVLQHLRFARHWLERAEGELNRAETDRAELTLSLAEAEVREAWEASRRARSAKLDLLSDTVRGWGRRAMAASPRTRGLWAGGIGALVIAGLFALSAPAAKAPVVEPGAAGLAVKAESIAGQSPRGADPEVRPPSDATVRSTAKATETGGPTPMPYQARVTETTAPARQAVEVPAVTAAPVATSAPEPQIAEAPPVSRREEAPLASGKVERAQVVPAVAEAPPPPVPVKTVEAQRQPEVHRAPESKSEPPAPAQPAKPAEPAVSVDLMELLQAAQKSLYDK